LDDAVAQAAVEILPGEFRQAVQASDLRVVVAVIGVLEEVLLLGMAGLCRVIGTG
jgi:hypothetical protein